MIDQEKLRKKKAECRYQTNKAIRGGLLVPRDSCEMCGEKRVEVHHLNYKNPFHIKWLCQKCHKKEHFPTYRPMAGRTAKQRHQLIFRETISFRDRLRAAAKVKGCTISKWMREAVEEKINREVK